MLVFESVVVPETERVVNDCVELITAFIVLLPLLYVKVIHVFGPVTSIDPTASWAASSLYPVIGDKLSSVVVPSPTKSC
jgi:hypothetical protein